NRPKFAPSLKRHCGIVGEGSSVSALLGHPLLQLCLQRGRGHILPCGERCNRMTTLPPSGFLRIGDSELEYRLIGPPPSEAPTIVMLHEGLGSAALWGDFPDRLQV